MLTVYQYFTSLSPRQFTHDKSRSPFGATKYDSTGMTGFR